MNSSISTHRFLYPFVNNFFRIFLLLFFCIKLNAQNIDTVKNNEVDTIKTALTSNKNLLEVFRKGTFSGHLRYFFMSTDNKNKLTDYYANALGGTIKYQTSLFHGFQFSISTAFTFDAGSSDLSKTDSSTGQLSRYELGLYDLTHPSNKKELVKLDELNISYHYKSSHVTIGRQSINSPFINLQDGRMMPTKVNGVLFQVNHFKNIKAEGGWLYSITPRGTSNWFSIENSIGINSSGVNIDGSKANYFNNIKSDGVGLLGVQAKLNKKLTINFWELLTENISNTNMLQLDFSQMNKDSSILFASIQSIKQYAINKGGNEDPSKTYFNQTQQSLSFGGKIGWRKNHVEASLNYNRITTLGRYLMPREWGKDPFFTFLTRERNEGFGDVNAFMGKVDYSFSKANCQTSLAVGYYQLPEVTNYRLNKYGMPSYTQINFDARYRFSGLLKGWDAAVLIVGKIKNGNTYDNNKFVINKVNMMNYNFILNFHF
jgi:hypothetical protein